MILVDTSAWISHLRSGDARLVEMLEGDRVVTCDIVVGEIELGVGLSKTIAELFDMLPRVPSPTSARTLAFVRRRRSVFSSSGVGWADAQIVVAAMEAGALVHSTDGPLSRVWRRLGFRLP